MILDSNTVYQAPKGYRAEVEGNTIRLIHCVKYYREVCDQKNFYKIVGEPNGGAKTMVVSEFNDGTYAISFDEWEKHGEHMVTSNMEEFEAVYQKAINSFNDIIKL